VTVIIRVEHRDRFVTVRNKTVRDKRLSFKARGVLVYLLSLPDDATVNREHLADHSPDGVWSIRSALAELAGAGYLEHRQVQDERGRWSTEVVVREAPRRRSTEGRKPAVGDRITDGGKSTTRSSTLKDHEGGPGGQSPSGPPPPSEYPCAACGAEGDYMRADGTWLCDEHRGLKVVGS
jgi:hypothetical protein